MKKLVCVILMLSLWSCVCSAETIERTSTEVVVSVNTPDGFPSNPESVDKITMVFKDGTRGSYWAWYIKPENKADALRDLMITYNCDTWMQLVIQHWDEVKAIMEDGK